MRCVGIAAATLQDRPLSALVTNSTAERLPASVTGSTAVLGPTKDGSPGTAIEPRYAERLGTGTARQLRPALCVT